MGRIARIASRRVGIGAAAPFILWISLVSDGGLLTPENDVAVARVAPSAPLIVIDNRPHPLAPEDEPAPWPIQVADR